MCRLYIFICILFCLSQFAIPESHHWLPLSLTNSCLVDLIDVTLAFEDANSNLVEVVTVGNDHAEDNVGNSLLQILELTFGPKAELLFRL